MLKKEAKWIGEMTQDLKIKKVLDISGGDWFFRNIRQPFIEKYIFSNLKNVVRTDINNDVCSKKFTKIGKFDLVLANNILEHVADIKNASKNILSVVATGGYLCVSVPFRFPYHPDPIDNGFRPTPKELAKLFPKTKVIKKSIIIQEMKIMIMRRGPQYFGFWVICLNTLCGA